jgi:cell division protein FtsQ
MLSRDVNVIDMRLAQRPTLRMSDAALADWVEIRQFAAPGQ